MFLPLDHWSSSLNQWDISLICIAISVWHIINVTIKTVMGKIWELQLTFKDHSLGGRKSVHLLCKHSTIGKHLTCFFPCSSLAYLTKEKSRTQKAPTVFLERGTWLEEPGDKSFVIKNNRGMCFVMCCMLPFVLIKCPEDSL